MNVPVIQISANDDFNRLVDDIDPCSCPGSDVAALIQIAPDDSAAAFLQGIEYIRVQLAAAGLDPKMAF
jgi:hypothetical protein